ncbi:VOC family protein [Phycicoccus sonneratiae]|uniref:VOC family protein n=1 Tax=Phycicoccus sonneratiae TaxID=2807628 RepID=A0ABS2CN45_9MICO|nr:VOC family protein [Phycicoccus sonneraticus]MBM6400494.1 VOC family protein [Phycicoccus sonneraticus]
MTVRLDALTVDALDPHRLARFWGGLLGWTPVADPHAPASLEPTDDTTFRLRFLPTDAPKTTQNRMHVEVTSETPGHQDRTVARALELGGRHVDVGQRPEEGHVVLADPEGNELCVLGAGNTWLADCGFFGDVACDGTHAVGVFWSEALGWPLVWDEGEETAVRSPSGGPKIAWGGPPLMPSTGRDRLRFDVAVPAAEADAELARLEGLGARRLTDGPDADGSWRVADVDGTEFRLLVD